METITDGGSDSPEPGYLNGEAKSPPVSESSSKPDPEKDVTPAAARTPSALDGALSLLQSAYDQALSLGLRAKSTEQTTRDGQMPVLTIQILNVSKCPGCRGWINGTTCPICQ